MEKPEASVAHNDMPSKILGMKYEQEEFDNGNSTLHRRVRKRHK
jgi:hypothetical protein